MQLSIYCLILKFSGWQNERERDQNSTYLPFKLNDV